MDNLSKDSTAALEAGMSYGQYKALHPHTRHDPKPITQRNRPCRWCGSQIPSKLHLNVKYCSPECTQAAINARSRNKYREKAGLTGKKQNHNRKLTAESVAECRNEWLTKGTPISALAARYGVHKSTMRNAIIGVTWRKLSNEEDQRWQLKSG